MKKEFLPLICLECHRIPLISKGKSKNITIQCSCGIKNVITLKKYFELIESIKENVQINNSCVKHEKKEFSTTFSVEMKTLLPAFEYGLLMCEIDEMLEKIPDDMSGLVMFRPNEYGEMEMRCGGVLETFRTSEYYSNIENPTLLSNTHKVPMLGRTKEELEKKDKVEDLIDRRYVTN